MGGVRDSFGGGLSGHLTKDRSPDLQNTLLIHSHTAHTLVCSMTIVTEIEKNMNNAGRGVFGGLPCYFGGGLLPWCRVADVATAI